MKTTQNLFFTVIVGLVLAGCQLKTVSDYYGTGPLQMSSRVSAGYEAYKKRPGPWFFAVSQDGRDYGYTYCAEGTCQDTIAQMAINSCNKRATVECKIYARRTSVVWDGPVKFPAASTATGSADVMCAFAVDYIGGTARWTTDTQRVKYVADAKKRGFSLKQCDEIN